MNNGVKNNIIFGCKSRIAELKRRKMNVCENLNFTRMCWNKNNCSDPNCKFAHSKEQLVALPCRFGDKCHFVECKNGDVANKWGFRTCYRIHPKESFDSFYNRTNKVKSGGTKSMIEQSIKFGLIPTPLIDSFLKKRKKSSVVEKSGGILFTKDLKAIVIVQNKYLLNENNKVLWGLPKGHVKKNESLAQCAEREIYEETGLELQVQESSPKILINKTYYFPILLQYQLEELMKKIHVNDDTEIVDVSILTIDQPEIASNNLNYELKLLLGQYIRRIVSILDTSNLRGLHRTIPAWKKSM